MPEITNHTSCPNCRHEWNLEEVRLQECEECGFPYHDSPQVISEAFGLSEFDPDYLGPDEQIPARL